MVYKESVRMGDTSEKSLVEVRCEQSWGDRLWVGRQSVWQNSAENRDMRCWSWVGVAWSGFFFVFKERVSNIKKRKIVALWPIILVADWIFDMVVHERIRQHRSSRPGFLLALPFPGLSAHGHATHAEGRLAVAAVMWQSKGSGSASQRQGN